MRWPILLTLCIALLGLSSCVPGDDADVKPAVNPTIIFSSGSGYTFQDDTIDMGDTVRVGVTIDKGTDAMHHFKVTVSYDGAVPLVTDSLPMGIDHFEFEKLIIARSQAGTEKWTFGIAENDGDIIRRSLILTVQ